ncbi:hypothetical protein D8B26_006405 [Coccidioides posadasii str. Silveira]|uniref:Uncharacterized protein n=2 Tax=Coccidioides posadasii TaxID=199306 RepID=E9CT20_COCPS|nr:conserved hypothetical protein [Coccidioides posadasii str. Silveira]KMM67371.1 hypothetical protein CPAG_03705 [Coccidioides posadasii RMSCC 3488]QVM11759.1 hypothetical protein D8B26_006405 [Coccidioides posadasii str. Silveira]
MASIQTRTDVAPTGTSAVTSAVPTACGATTYDIPTKDAACAVPGTEHKDSMEKCCDAPVVTYNEGCGMYCLASGGTVGDLVKCLIGDGIADGKVFCNKEMNATATTTPTPTGRDDDDDHDDDDDEPTNTDGSPASTSSSAALANLPPQTLSKPAIGVLFTLFFSTFAGVVFA